MPTNTDIAKIIAARHRDPFAVLGRHHQAGLTIVRTFKPHAKSVTIAEGGFVMHRVGETDLFEWQGDGRNRRPRGDVRPAGQRLHQDTPFGKSATCWFGPPRRWKFQCSGASGT